MMEVEQEEAEKMRMFLGQLDSKAQQASSNIQEIDMGGSGRQD